MAAVDPRLHQAGALLQQRRFGEARQLLSALVSASPLDGEAARFLAAAELGLGDTSAAARTLREAIVRLPDAAALHAALGDVLARSGDVEDAEIALREAVRLDPTQTAALLTLVRLLRARDRARDALPWAHALARLLPRVAEAQAELARTLAAAGEVSQAVEAHRHAASLDPGNAGLRLGLALALIDAERYTEADAELRTLRQRGVDAPELWFGLARAALGLDRGDEAETAFRAAIQRRPDYLAAHTDLAQAVWTRTGDVAAACAEIERCLRAQPHLSVLRVAKAGIYRNAGEVGIAYAQLREALETAPDDAELLLAAADAGLVVDPDNALRYAIAAASLLPAEASVLWTLADAQLATGDAANAEVTARRLLALNADDQHALAVLASAQRLQGGERDAELIAGPDIVRAWTIDTPSGWPDLTAYLRDLATSLRRLHTTRAHPLGQTLREGTQTNQDLTRSDDAAIQAFVQAIDGPIRRHLAALGQGDGPLRRRNSGNYRIQGMWSVQLRPHGFHVNHFHPEGWLSSACYIDLPSAVGDTSDHAGWIQFGEPGIRTTPPLAPEYAVRPQPGMLALFPSYLWHGTVPFAGEPHETRLTIAFDVVPAWHAPAR